jgi:hypothetical protein
MLATNNFHGKPKRMFKLQLHASPVERLEVKARTEIVRNPQHNSFGISFTETSVASNRDGFSALDLPNIAVLVFHSRSGADTFYSLQPDLYAD